MSAHTLVDQLLGEARALANYTVGKGLAVPAEAIQTLAEIPADASGSDVDIGRLLAAHQAMAKLVAPATPRDIKLLVDKGGDHLAPAKRLMIQMLVVAVTSLIGFLATSLSEYVCNPAYGNLYTSHGIPLLVNELFYLFAAAVGASFWILMEMLMQSRKGGVMMNETVSYWNQFLTTSQLWLRFILGLIAGLILATLMDSGSLADTESHATTRYTAAFMALLGGFSARAVFKMLYRIVLSIENIVVDGQSSDKTGEPEALAPLRAPDANAPDRAGAGETTRRPDEIEPPQAEISSAEAADTTAEADQPAPSGADEPGEPGAGNRPEPAALSSRSG